MIILQTRQLTKHFGALAALSELDLDVDEGGIHGIMGPNGAGKTTLINIISGVCPPTSGRIYYRGKDITGLKANVIGGMRIGRTFQTLRTFREMTAIENVMVGQHCRTSHNLLGTFIRPPFHDLANERALRENAESLLERVGLQDSASKTVTELSLMQQRRLEIARALGMEPKLLLLDEPSAGMTVAESAELQQFIQKIASEGVTIILIGHDMALMMTVSQIITVLNFGRKIAEGTPLEVRQNREVITAYLGED